MHWNGENIYSTLNIYRSNFIELSVIFIVMEIIKIRNLMGIWIL